MGRQETSQATVTGFRASGPAALDGHGAPHGGETLQTLLRLAFRHIPLWKAFWLYAFAGGVAVQLGAAQGLLPTPIHWGLLHLFAVSACFLVRRAAHRLGRRPRSAAGGDRKGAQ